jgi:hypothetical protein
VGLYGTVLCSEHAPYAERIRRRWEEVYALQREANEARKAVKVD